VDTKVGSVAGEKNGDRHLCPLPSIRPDRRVRIGDRGVSPHFFGRRRRGANAPEGDVRECAIRGSFGVLRLVDAAACGVEGRGRGAGGEGGGWAAIEIVTDDGDEWKLKMELDWFLEIQDQMPRRGILNVTIDNREGRVSTGWHRV